jgi:hypothetical protein
VGGQNFVIRQKDAALYSDNDKSAFMRYFGIAPKDSDRLVSVTVCVCVCVLSMLGLIC